MTASLRLRLTPFEGALARPARNARQAWSSRRGIRVGVEDRSGGFGFGEATPLSGVSPESFSDALGDLTEAAARTLEAPTSVEEAFRVASALGSPAARFGMETALLDWLGRVRGAPVHRLLAPALAARPLPLAFLLSSGKEAEILEEARTSVEAGYGCLKMKIGRDLAFELGVLAALRAELGAGVALRVDANGTLAPDRVTAVLASLAELGVALAEEPVPGPVLATLPISPVPLALDETLARPGAVPLVQDLLESGRCRALVLKPTVLGGFSACLRWAGLADVHGARVIVSHVFEGPAAFAAQASLALSLAVEPDPMPAGLAPHGGLALWPGVRAARVEGARIVPEGPPGIGLVGAEAP